MRASRWVLLLVLSTFATGAAAEYPDHPIRLIVPQAAGSATDTVARLLGAELAKEIGQPIVIDNRAGGALTIGIDLTAKSAPDGYTIGMGPIGALAKSDATTTRANRTLRMSSSPRLDAPTSGWSVSRSCGIGTHSRFIRWRMSLSANRYPLRRDMR